MYTLFHCHSQYSLLDGFSRPKDIVKRAKELGMKSIGISDHGSVSAHVEFYEECKKQDIKPILGIEFYIGLEPVPLKKDRSNTHMVCWAKNEQGLKDLWKASSYANQEDIFYYKPRINIHNWTNPETKKEYYGLEHFCKDGNIFGMSGHQGSLLSDFLFCDVFGDPTKRKSELKKAYGQYKNVDTEYYRQFLKPNWFESTCKSALELESVFGKGNFFIELQDELNPNDQLALWIHPLIVECLRKVSEATNIPSIASSDPHYAYPEQAEDQRLMVAVNMKETEETINKKLSSSDELDLMVFFGSNNFFIHSYEEMSKKFSKDELERTNQIADQITDYNLIKKPEVPKFKVPEFDKNLPYLKNIQKDSDKFLFYTVVNNAKEMKPWENDTGYTKKQYWDRIKYETNIIFKAGLSDYLLIVWDFLSFCRYCPADGSFDWMNNFQRKGKINPIIIGAGRGSVGSCLTAFFLKIHDADSLKYDLLFNRFFNEARLNDLMDIDCDIEVSRRDEVVEYLRHKYGNGNVGQIISFGSMKGRGCIKDAIRVKGIENGFEIANKITEYIPDESKIADQIQEMKEAGEDYGIIYWALDNSEELMEFYKDVKYKSIIDQAIRIEGTKRNMSRHASGYVVTTKPIEDCFPMVWDTKSKKRIIGFDMRDVSKVGGVKIDLLGLALLDKLSLCQKLVNNA